MKLVTKHPVIDPTNGKNLRTQFSSDTHTIAEEDGFVEVVGKAGRTRVAAENVSCTFMPHPKTEPLASPADETAEHTPIRPKAKARPSAKRGKS